MSRKIRPDVQHTFWGQVLFDERERLRAAMEREIEGERPHYGGGLLTSLIDEALPLDPLYSVGLGFGASQRARILAFKGLIAELDEAIQVEVRKASKGGAPRKSISKDEMRALSVIYQVWNSPDGAYRQTSDVVRDLIMTERCSPREAGRQGELAPFSTGHLGMIMEA